MAIDTGTLALALALAIRQSPGISTRRATMGHPLNAPGEGAPCPYGMATMVILSLHTRHSLRVQLSLAFCIAPGGCIYIATSKGLS